MHFHLIQIKISDFDSFLTFQIYMSICLNFITNLRFRKYTRNRPCWSKVYSKLAKS